MNQTSNPPSDKPTIFSRIFKYVAVTFLSLFFGFVTFLGLGSQISSSAGLAGLAILNIVFIFSIVATIIYFLVFLLIINEGPRYGSLIVYSLAGACLIVAIIYFVFLMIAGNISAHANEEFNQAMAIRGSVAQIAIKKATSTDVGAPQSDLSNISMEILATPTAATNTTQTEIDRASQWLHGQGFTVTSAFPISNGQNMLLGEIYFTGTIQQIDSAFGVDIHQYIVSYAGQDSNCLSASHGTIIGGFPTRLLPVPTVLSTIVSTTTLVSDACISG